MKTKLIALFFAFAASIGTLFAQSGSCGDNLTWNLSNGTLTISGTGAMENYLFHYNSPWYYYRADITRIVIGNSVTSIGECAFGDCQGLTSVTIPNSVKYIGFRAFMLCSNLQSVIIGNGVTDISSMVFQNCSIDTLIIGNSVDTIVIGAFAYAWGNRRHSYITCYAETPPTTIGQDDEYIHEWGPFDEWTGGEEPLNVYVPTNSVEAYKNADGWKNQHIYPIGATPTTTDTRIVTIGTADNSALFTWPITENANTYSLQITKDGEVFCTLIFNSNGQLTGIAFAPSRDRSSQMPSATMSVSAMSFTVTGLDAASKYAYRLSVTDEAQNEIQAYSGEFATTGYEGEINEGGEPEIVDTDGIEEVVNIVNCQSSNRKFMIDGQLFILREGKIFNAQGARVR